MYTAGPVGFNAMVPTQSHTATMTRSGVWLRELVSTGDHPGGVVYLIKGNSAERDPILELLKATGIEAISFGTGREFLEFTKLENVRPDTPACLILDLQLPDMSGLDLQRKLARNSNPPIIFVSGQVDIRAIVSAMKAGAIEFLAEPVESQALHSAIAAALAKDREQRRTAAEQAILRRRFAALTPRERDVLPLVVSGMLNKQAAAVLGITEVTLQVHRGQIMRKMEANSFADLIRMTGRLEVSGEPDLS
jgi:FixJ family two-component response regulator